MLTLDLTQGITETEQYKAFKFPGGEVHFKMNPTTEKSIFITTRLNTSDDIMLLIIAVDTLAKEGISDIEVFIPYMPYQQADRDFSEFESFSLKSITRILNTLPVSRFKVYDAHSDVTAALLNECRVMDNSIFIKNVVDMLNERGAENLTLLSPDAGAYKKIGKLAAKIDFKGSVTECFSSINI